MIDIQLLTTTVEKAIELTDAFIVDITIGSGNAIVVTLDSDTSMDIDTCAAVTRAIEATFDRDVEDYDLEVGSAGLTSPLTVRRQWEKNIGNKIEIYTTDNKKVVGVLDTIDTDNYTIIVSTRKKVEGKKRPVSVDEPLTLTFNNTRQARPIIEF